MLPQLTLLNWFTALDQATLKQSIGGEVPSGGKALSAQWNPILKPAGISSVSCQLR